MVPPHSFGCFFYLNPRPKTGSCQVGFLLPDLRHPGALDRLFSAETRPTSRGEWNFTTLAHQGRTCRPAGRGPAGRMPARCVRGSAAGPAGPPEPCSSSKPPTGGLFAPPVFDPDDFPDRQNRHTIQKYICFDSTNDLSRFCQFGLARFGTYSHASDLRA